MEFHVVTDIWFQYLKLKEKLKPINKFLQRVIEGKIKGGWGWE